MPSNRIFNAVTVADKGDGTYDFVVGDVAVDSGDHTIFFKRTGSNAASWKFTNISVWEGQKSDEPSTPSLVAPFTMRRLQDATIKIEDNNPQVGGTTATYSYRLYGEYNGVSIDHDPEIVNRGA